MPTVLRTGKASLLKRKNTACFLCHRRGRTWIRLGVYDAKKGPGSGPGGEDRGERPINHARLSVEYGKWLFRKTSLPAGTYWRAYDIAQAQQYSSVLRLTCWFCVFFCLVLLLREILLLLWHISQPISTAGGERGC